MSKKERSWRGVGMRGRLVICFGTFSLFIILMIWLFQVRLFEFFYEKTKLKEIDKAAETISRVLDDEDLLAEVAFGFSDEYGICVRIFEVYSPSAGREAVSFDRSPTCMIHKLDYSGLYTYYSNAVSEGGEWSSRSLGGAVRSDASPSKAGDGNVTYILVRAVSDGEGRNWAIFLNTEFAPKQSTVTSIGTQFVWLAAVLVVSGMLLGYVFSSQIARPLKRMTAAAKELAAGNYNADFEPNGYRETRDLAKALNVAAQEIGKTDALKRELMANVSHDLRTPLTMITGYAEMMRDIPGENTPENVQIIVDEANRLTALVNDMLDLSKTEAVTERLERTRFDLTDAVRDIAGRYSKMLESSGVCVEFEYSENVSVYADRGKILQVVSNLVNNAVNYCGEDKTVTVVQTSDENGKVRISVSDTGDGIPPDKLPYIWDRYYKVDKVHRRAFVGSGLGLSIVKNILQLHGASYGVESCVGKGSTFWFELDSVE